MTRTPEQNRSGTLAVAVVCVLAAVAYLGIGLIQGQVGLGLIGVGIMAGYGLFLVWGRRHSEVISLLAGEGTDERQRGIAEQAWSVTAQILVALIIIAALTGMAVDAEWTWAFSGLAVVSAVAWVSSVAVLSRRR